MYSNYLKHHFYATISSNKSRKKHFQTALVQKLNFTTASSKTECSCLSVIMPSCHFVFSLFCIHIFSFSFRIPILLLSCPIFLSSVLVHLCLSSYTLVFLPSCFLSCCHSIFSLSFPVCLSVFLAFCCSLPVFLSSEINQPRTSHNNLSDILPSCLFVFMSSFYLSDFILAVALPYINELQ